MIFFAPLRLCEILKTLLLKNSFCYNSFSWREINYPVIIKLLCAFFLFSRKGAKAQSLNS
jgi:hypothetical protein